VRKSVKFSAVVVLNLGLALGLAAQMSWPAPDLDAIHKIKTEGFAHSQVMETMSYLTDVYGPRLTNSPDIKEAGQYAMKTLTSWGLSNVKEETWGPFGRGWSNELFEANVISPRHFPLIAYPMAWSPGTNGTVTAEVVYVEISNDQDFDKYKGQLKGKFVMTEPMREIEPNFTADAHRYTDEELAELAVEPVPAGRGGRGGRGGPAAFAAFAAQRELNAKIQKFLVDEGVAAWLSPSPHDDGTIQVQSVSRDPNVPSPPRVVVDVENYGRIMRILEKKIPVTLQMNIVNKFYDDDLNSFNITAEIPGTDKADELVMLGGHFDSWHSGTGATDNGAGSVVMMEAIRILKATGLKMRRTVRLGLWTGEEEGLLGSRAYVAQHFAAPSADNKEWMLKPEHAKLSGYFNVDNGTGRIRGVYLQGNEAVAPIFQKWMEPFHDLGMTTLTIRNTGGTDHLSYAAVGLPGFQFIQDPLDYETRTHHTNMDVYERISEPDMKQMAVIVASFVYMTANAPQMLPRVPMPPVPPPPGGRGGRGM